MTDQPRDELFDRYLRDELTAADRTELTRRLQGDLDQRRAFMAHVLEFQAIASITGQQLAASGSTAVPPDLDPAARFRRHGATGRHASRVQKGPLARRLRPWTRVLAAVSSAAVLAITCAIWWLPASTSEVAQPPVGHESLAIAWVLPDPDVGVLGNGQPLLAGVASIIHTGDRLEATQGPLTIVLNDGSRLRLVAGGNLGFGPRVDAPVVQLAHGRLEAEIAHQPAGHSLVISTRTAEIRVIGTTFSVDESAAATRVEVEQGVVRCRRAEDGAEVDVRAGEQTLVAPTISLTASRSPPRPAQTAQTLVVTCEADAMVRGGNGFSAQNFGTEPRLDIKSRDVASLQREVYLRFRLPVSLGVVQAARLRLHEIKVGIKAPVLLAADEVVGPWDERTITFDVRPSSTRTVALWRSAGVVGQIRVDLTSAVRAAQAAGRQELTLRLHSLVQARANGGVIFAAREDGQITPPALEIDLPP